MSAVLASGKATLYELQTHLGTKDLYDLADLVVVEAHNARLWAKHRAK